MTTNNVMEIINNAEANGLDEGQVCKAVINAVDKAIAKWLETKTDISDLQRYETAEEENNIFSFVSYQYNTKYYNISNNGKDKTRYFINIMCDNYDESFDYPLLSISACTESGYLTTHYVGVSEEEYIRNVKVAHLVNGPISIGRLDYNDGMNAFVASCGINTEYINLSNDLFNIIESAVVGILRFNADFFKAVFEDGKDPTEELYNSIPRSLYYVCGAKEEENEKES